eukprot:7073083-Alexandrium_andersonii.AAC.1
MRRRRHPAARSRGPGGLRRALRRQPASQPGGHARRREGPAGLGQDPGLPRPAAGPGARGRQAPPQVAPGGGAEAARAARRFALPPLERAGAAAAGPGR